MAAIWVPEGLTVGCCKSLGRKKSITGIFSVSGTGVIRSRSDVAAMSEAEANTARQAADARKVCFKIAMALGDGVEKLREPRLRLRVCNMISRQIRGKQICIPPPDGASWCCCRQSVSDYDFGMRF